ncbi:hypothetical protein PQO03_03320 [Lentisphaera profundi]|uniref:Serine protease n=1 Tax=Lentisphaera profundi TaxID=1658616 RepID=A0ABY7VS07_9BACT|nr:hypothetical protein [Lentisphaera profundi]WDE96990.1 hypothetical protein PQO03_03320 [Lentisphaera profundi]
MVKKSVMKNIFSLLIITFFVSCASEDRSHYKRLQTLENDIVNIVPILQDNSAILTDAKGQRTAILIPGGLLLTSSLNSDKSGELMSLDFPHSSQLQVVIVGLNKHLMVVRLVSNLNHPNSKGIGFSTTEELSGTGLFISFSDTNAPYPAIRLVRDLSDPLNSFTFDELDDGGAFVNMKGELCGIYSHSDKTFIGPKDFRRMWLSILESN